jgi:hypothetical protein
LVGVNGGVEEAGVPPTVPRDVDEADQALMMIRAQLYQAAPEGEPKRRLV